MKPIRLNKILKNLRKGQVNKKDIWVDVNPEILNRIKLQLAFAKNQVRYYSEEKKKARFKDQLKDAKVAEKAYTQILARLT